MSRRGIKKLFSGCQTCEDIFSLFIAGCSISGEMGSVFVHCLGSLHWQNSQKASFQRTNQGTPFIIICHIQGHLFTIRRSHSHTCYFLKINCLLFTADKKRIANLGQTYSIRDKQSFSSLTVHCDHFNCVSEICVFSGSSHNWLRSHRLYILLW